MILRVFYSTKDFECSHPFSDAFYFIRNHIICRMCDFFQRDLFGTLKCAIMESQQKRGD